MNMQLKHYIYIAAFGLTFLSVSGNVSYALDVEETRLNLHLLQMEQMKLEKNQKESTLKLQAEENQLKDLQKKLVAQAAKTKQTEQALIEKEQAFALAICFHLWVNFIQALTGIFSLHFIEISFKELLSRVFEQTKAKKT